MILNDVKVIGNLVNDPEVRFTPKGTPVANLSPVTVVGLPTKTQVRAAYLIGAATGVLSYQGIGLLFAPL